MLNVNRAAIRDQGVPVAAESSMVDVSQVTAMVRRRWKMIAGIAAVFLVFGVIYLLLATPMFLAESEVIVDTQTSQAMQRQDMTELGQVDTSLVDSQVEILNSDSTAVTVVRKLDLTTDPEFVGPATGVASIITGAIGKVIGGVTSLLGVQKSEADNPERRAVEAFKKGLIVKRTGLTYVITIGYWSVDKEKAARIANAVANAYIDSVLDARFAATRRTGDWLEGRLQQIRRQANDADRALEIFKSGHNIVDTNRGLMSEQQLAEMTTALATARASTAETKARLDRAVDVAKDPLAGGTVSDALNNQVISRLRAQYLDLANKANDLASRYGGTHRTVSDLHNQMEQIKRSVQDELQRISHAYESDYSIAKVRQDSLEASMNQLVSQNGSTSLDKVKLQDLESTADSFRALYNGYLQRFQEATQRESFPIADARIITEATPPLSKGTPKSMLVLAGAMGLGVFFGVGLAFARELVDSFVTPEDVERSTGLPCLGILPIIGAGTNSPRLLRRTAAGEGSSGRSVDTLVLDAPFSRYAETIRNIKISVDTLQGGTNAQVIAVTSAVPNEGKTTVAINLAQMIANSGNRVLLIDGDLSNRRLTERAGNDAKAGLLEALSNLALLPTLVRKDARSGLDILPCAADAPIAHRSEILASEQMAQLLSKARERYQYIILDLAPIVPVVDAKAVARMVDCFVLVIEWRQTSRKVVAEAMSTEAIQQRTLGAVLNKVDPRALQQMEIYKGKAINGYYIDDKIA